MKPESMPTPTVHLNGTSREELIEQRLEVYRAVDTLVSALCGATPNGRDYYVQESGAFPKARDVHSARITWLRELQQDVMREAEEITDQ